MKNGIRLIFALAFGMLCAGSLHALTSKPIGLAPTQLDSDGIANLRVTTIGGGGAAQAVSIIANANGVQFDVTGTVAIHSATTGLAVNVSNTVNSTIQSATTGLAVNVSNTVNSTIQSATTGLAVNVSNTVNTLTALNAATTGQAVHVSNTVAITCAACGTEATQATAANQALAFGYLTSTATGQSVFALNATTGTAVNSVLLTRTSKTSLMINNSAAGVITYILQASSTPPAALAAGSYFILPAGDTINLNTSQFTLGTDDVYFFYSNLNAVTCTARLKW